MAEHSLINSGQDSRCTLCNKCFDSDEDPSDYICEPIVQAPPVVSKTRSAYVSRSLMARRPYTPRRR